MDISFPDLNCMDRIREPQVKSDAAGYLNNSSGPPSKKRKVDKEDMISLFISLSKNVIQECHDTVLHLLRSFEEPERTMQSGIFLVLFFNIDMDIEDIMVNWITGISENTNFHAADITTLVHGYPFKVSSPMDTKDRLHSIAVHRNDVSHQQRKVLGFHLRNKLNGTVCDFLDNYQLWDTNNDAHEERNVSLKFSLKGGKFI